VTDTSIPRTDEDAETSEDVAEASASVDASEASASDSAGAPEASATSASSASEGGKDNGKADDSELFRQTGSPSRLLLDVGGYRANRRKELAAVAKNAVEKVKEYGEAVRLEPMSAFERKCVHDVVNALAGVESESEGVEPHRRIVVRPVS